MQKEKYWISQGKQEPIAIIGLSCRFPGGSNNPITFWELLISGKDAIIDVPKDRWEIRRFYDPNQEKPGKMYVRSGGFLQERVDQFDALFFGISPREAACLDPQQRILLEVAWEALEDAGIASNQLAGSDTGVYIGGFMLDNIMTQIGYLTRHLIGLHTAVSFTHTMLSNRLSYVFDLRGPSITIDTACSSSLVALHEACQSLWRHECSLALVGGVNIMHRPEAPIVMCKGQLLASDGHSKSFDERADGYGRGEGAGIVVLKPFSSAQKEGDDIYALIRATGVNQDGRTSGITVPNPDSQERLIRQVCSQANVTPQQIRYVEAHGTGTAIGDPLECQALGAVLGQGRSADNACLVGSVKANIGHLEAAAGIASVIKSALCLKYKQIPPVANLKNPNPKIPFEAIGLRLPLNLEPVPKGEGPAYIGINSFGYGGTNAHAILEEMPGNLEESPAEDAPGTPYLLPLSARSEKALSALAQSYIDFLSDNTSSLRDICYSTAVRREHHNCRLALVADTKQSMVEQLQSFVKGQSGHLAVGQIVPGQVVKPVFVFTGMGPQWWAMGQELLQYEPVFRHAAEECDAVFQRVAGWSILDEMKVDESRSKMNETQIAQPANFVLQTALTALWRSWRVEPAAIVGHSVGEVSAIYTAGILGLEEAIRVSYHRSRLQKKIAGQGKMLAIGLTKEEVQTILVGYEEQVSFAAINSPSSVTLSGESTALEEIAAQLDTKGVFNRFLKVELAYHSPLMDQLKDEMQASLSMLHPKAPSTPFYSTVTGQIVTAATGDATYWCDNIRQPVLFAQSIENLIHDGYQLFLEIGPHPVLSSSIKECLSYHGANGSVITSLHRKESERMALLKALGNLHILNSSIDFKQVYKTGNYVKLPTYPWQRETYWNESEESIYDRLGSTEHPLLGHLLKNIPSNNSISWENSLNGNFLPYIVDHRVEELVVLPGAAYVEIGLAVSNYVEKREACALEGIQFHRALVVDSEDDPVIHVNYDKETHEYTVYSCSRNKNWILHATGSVSQLKIGSAAQINLNDLCRRCPTPMDADTVYAQLQERGLQYGPYFRIIHRLWVGSGEVVAQIEEHETSVNEEQNYLHPTILDACFQSLLFIDRKTEDNNTYLPVSIRQVRFYAPQPKGHLWSYGWKTKRTQRTIEANAILCDNDGNVFVEVRGILAQALAIKQNELLEEQWKKFIYEFAWEKAEREATTIQHGQWLLFLDQQGTGEYLINRLYATGAKEVISVLPGLTFQQEDAGHFQISRDSKEDMQRLLKATGIGEGWRIVYLWGLDAPIVGDGDPTGIADCLSCLYLIQVLTNINQLSSLHFFLVTCGVQQVHSDTPSQSLAQAPLMGLIRVAINEHPNIHFHLVDVDPDKDIDDSLLEELTVDSPDEEIVLRGVDRLVHRFRQIPVSEPELIPVAADSSVELETNAPSNLESLYFREKQRQCPDLKEIEIEIHAASLTEEDVLKIKSRNAETVPEHSFYGNRLGTVSGVISQVGTGIENYSVGKEIVAFVSDHFCSHITRPIDSLFFVPKPDNISHAECVSLPRTFMTAYYGLQFVAKLQPGEKVLIHAATTGIGLAAIQVAQRLGAEIFVTVDSREKQDYLHSLGIKHIMDFHSLDCTDQIMVLTNGRGVDVIMDTLPKETTLKDFSILRSLGRFIKVSRQDIVNNYRFPLPFNRNLTFAVVDIDGLMSERPDTFRKIFNEAWELMMAQDVTPPPVKVFPAAQVANAFEYTTSSEQIGNIAISMRNQQVTSTLPRVMNKILFHADSSYLITGGFGGLGLEVAKWMVKSGCRNLVLVGRSGAATEKAQHTVEELKNAGAKVLTAAVDIAQESQVVKLMQEIDATMPPLKGIMHAAAVLDDAPIVELSEQQFSRVMAPKAVGAWYLHQSTQNRALDFFVLFSSIASQMGSPGQGNYVAANTFIDALAHYRRAKGLPATSINWGALSEVGMVARNEKTKKYLEHMGIKVISPIQAIKALGHMLHLSPVQCSVVHADWQQLGQVNPVFAASLRFSHLLTSRRQEADKITSYRHLQELEPNKWKDKIRLLLSEQVAKTLRLPTEEISFDQSLINIGMDSLMAVELQMAINKMFGVKIPPLELLKGNSIIQLVEQIMVKMDGMADTNIAGSAQHNAGSADSRNNVWIEGEL